MIRLNYQFKTVGPLFTGSDVSAGTLRTLRRQKCALTTPIEYTSRLTDAQRRDAIVQICLGVWYSLNWDTIKGTRAMGIYDEFTNKLIAAARSANKYQFLENLCRSWGIESITDRKVLDAIDALSDYELLDTVRNESMYIVLKMRAVKDEAKARKDKNGGDLLFELEEIKPADPQPVMRTEDFIPCISGNSFRGRLRRLVMMDFCKRAGIERLDKKVYHTLFTGGFLDQSTQYEDFDRMEEFVKHCPMLGLFGSAIGNMTIEGELMMGWAYPVCRERGTGDKSYWQYLDTVFQTRHDSSKTEDGIEITAPPSVDDGKKEAPTQMKYEYEVFAPGTPFEHRIACTSDKPLITGAFGHMLDLFDKSPFVGGQGSVGNGELELFLPDTPDCNPRVYLDYLEAEQDSIQQFWAGLKM